MQSGRKLTVIAAATALVAATSLGASVAADEVDPGFVGVLDFTEDGTNALFWHGGEVGEGMWHRWPFGLLNRQTCENSPCFAFSFDVADPGAELRLGIDVPERVDEFEFALHAPDGRSWTERNPNRYNQEIRVTNPPLGTWGVTVRPLNAENSPFGLRAGLLAEPFEPTPDEEGLLLPNLRMTPPFELGFVAPANPLNGLWPPDNANPPLEVAGVAPVSCAADEMVEDGSLRCLRFSFGLENAGDGNFDIRYTSGTTDRAGPAWQCVQRAGQPPLRREAGSWEYHWTHGHDHYHDIVEHELLRVVDAETGELAAAGAGEKLGYSPADQHFADWGEFIQAPPGTGGSAGNCAPETNRRLGLSRGWGDVYRWQRPGNYVDFGDNPDGGYVVRLTADPMNHVQETTVADNTAYAWIVVTGDDVTVVEQGQGADPWDPDKIVIRSRFGPDLPSSRMPPPG